MLLLKANAIQTYVWPIRFLSSSPTLSVQCHIKMCPTLLLFVAFVGVATGCPRFCTCIRSLSAIRCSGLNAAQLRSFASYRFVTLNKLRGSLNCAALYGHHQDQVWTLTNVRPVLCRNLTECLQLQNVTIISNCKTDNTSRESAKEPVTQRTSTEMTTRKSGDKGRAGGVKADKGRAGGGKGHSKGEGQIKGASGKGASGKGHSKGQVKGASGKGGGEGQSKGDKGHSKGGTKGHSKGGTKGHSKGGAKGHSKGGAKGQSKGGAKGHSKGGAKGQRGEAPTTDQIPRPTAEIWVDRSGAIGYATTTEEPTTTTSYMWWLHRPWNGTEPQITQIRTPPPPEPKKFQISIDRSEAIGYLPPTSTAPTTTPYKWWLHERTTAPQTPTPIVFVEKPRAPLHVENLDLEARIVAAGVWDESVRMEEAGTDSFTLEHETRADERTVDHETNVWLQGNTILQLLADPLRLKTDRKHTKTNAVQYSSWSASDPVLNLFSETLEILNSNATEQSLVVMDGEEGPWRETDLVRHLESEAVELDGAPVPDEQTRVNYDRTAVRKPERPADLPIVLLTITTFLVFVHLLGVFVCLLEWCHQND